MMQKADKIHHTVAFVCTGNTCRSPMAEGIFNTMAEDRGLDVRAVSFGMAAASGTPVSKNAVDACAEIGVDLSEKKSHFAYDYDPSQFEHFYSMTDEHKMILHQCLGVPLEMITSLGVSDPFGGNLDVYRRCRDEIYRCVQQIIRNYED